MLNIYKIKKLNRTNVYVVEKLYYPFDTFIIYFNEDKQIQLVTTPSNNTLYNREHIQNKNLYLHYAWIEPKNAEKVDELIRKITVTNFLKESRVRSFSV